MSATPGPLKTVLMTGGCGTIGQILLKSLAGRYALTVLDKNQPCKPLAVPFIQADIGVMPGPELAIHFAGQETILHLAADQNPDAAWESLLTNNINATANVLSAASLAGCKRVIFSSSLRTVTGYPKKTFIHAGLPANPDSLYGASKAWGETLGRYYSRQENLSVLCLRIGSLKPAAEINRKTYHPERIITPRDLVHLFDCALQAPDSLRYGIFHGVSNNRIQPFDLEEARQRLGYSPQDDAFQLAEQNHLSNFRHWLKKTILGWFGKVKS